ncbi:MAG: hypothetical protein JXN60_07990 [Lentisphaerae bacterium]|nr:hypothetical protein [Lentisphaerota bacterium]
MSLDSAVNRQATESAYGGLATDAATYRPLDTVTVRIKARTDTDEHCKIRVCDTEQRQYFEADVPINDSRGEVQFSAGSSLGTHYVYLIWPGEKNHSRYINFRLDCETCIESGNADFDDLFPLTRDGLLRGRREYDTKAGRIVGYIAADTVHFDGIWLRDWTYGLPAYRYWERDMTCGLDRFFEHQDNNGMIPDGIERDGRTWRVGLESDVEYIMTLAVWRTWQTTGDDRWLERMLPALERALSYIRSDAKHWDPEHALVKRQHSCDTWDFDIEGASDHGDRRHVIAVCDQSGYFQAYEAMSQMCSHLGKDAEAQKWRKEAKAYRKRANDLLWDGTKYLHHVHLDDIDHGDFDEKKQLAMGNTWAMTRGLASPSQARSIIDEYRKRHAQTGDAYPWWSLQPGYPDHLGYFTSRPYCQQGGYANGGLMPWVGGELCRAAFLFGRESYGVELMRNYVALLRIQGGVNTWYWPNGEPGFRTRNEVPYPPWGMAEWVNALVEGLIGIHDDNGLLRTITVSPRWNAAGINDARISVRYATSKAYCSYRMQVDEAKQVIRLTYTGSGEQASFRILIPGSWNVVSVNQETSSLDYQIHQEDTSRYVCFSAKMSGVLSVAVKCKINQL